MAPFTVSRVTVGAPGKGNTISETETIAVRSDRAKSVTRSVPGSGGAEIYREITLPSRQFYSLNLVLGIMSSGYYSDRTLARLLPPANPSVGCVDPMDTSRVALIGTETIRGRNTFVVTYDSISGVAPATVEHRVTEWRDPGVGCLPLQREVDVVSSDGTRTPASRMYTTALEVGTEPDPARYEVPPFAEVPPSEHERRWLAYIGQPITPKLSNKWPRIDALYEKMRHP
jgi:hypothetical protein